MNIASQNIDLQTVLNALSDFVEQSPGIRFADYSGGIHYYRQDRRHVAQALNDFRTIYDIVRLYQVPAETILAAAKGGRLEFNANMVVEYKEGQNFSTEYRDAACALLSTALWRHWRDISGNAQTVQKTAKHHFHRGIVSRWFS